MAELSSVDRNVVPPRVTFPRSYNAAHDLIERNLQAGRGDRLAFIDDRGSCTYAELARRVNRFASSLAGLGLRPEDRVLVCMLDTIDWPVAFLGAIKAGVVPIAVNTLLRSKDYEYMLRDSRAQVLFVSQALLPVFEELAGRIPTLRHTVVSRAPLEAGGAAPQGPGITDFDALLASGSDTFEPADTIADEACFWLYSSGSTGAPKGTVHIHSSLVETAELYALPVLGIRESDIVFSAAKLFFAYGLGNGLTFPLSVGATALLMAERPTPEAVFQRLTGEAPQALVQLHARPTIHYGVPTLYASMLASKAFPAREQLGLRVATSAGEALPERVGAAFTERTGVEILDGIGSTEMLHIFLSNQAGRVRYGTTGRPVPGYSLSLRGEDGHEVGTGEVGDLYIRGPSAAAMYWNQREKTRGTFQGEWTRSGDKYVRDADGYYTYAGRSDDMLKVSGQYVSPFEVESAVASHPAVLEAAVVGVDDADHLIKPKAYVVLKDPAQASPQLAEAIRAHVKDRLAPFKYPRWIEFIEELPKTATGKIQRYKLRG
ncbi:MAG: benzoate-CoA ligase family protein [Burkholderiales bacterium]|nr:benzoate-CoA ligase family protein [Burkholderiales bacterium]OJX07363.1 MAG: 4-hydroxybenzoate--CoA ligase [Burkholderiales bacterium 70-64]